MSGPPDDEHRTDDRAPWGFRILLVLAAIYLLYRFGQMGAVFVDWITR